MIAQWEILAPALFAGCLVLATHIPLGREVLRRGIIFIDLAVAQIAGLGVIAAARLGWEPHGWRAQLAAVAGALVGALALGLAERRLGRHQEAVIGVAFVLAASGGVLLLAGDAHGGDALRELLAGQILWVDWSLLARAAAVTAALLGGWALLGAGARRGIGFYLLFAVAVTLSVQLVGVYLVFASLIVPALATVRQPPHRQLPTAWVLGLAGYGAGLTLSAWLDLPSGAVIVWCLALAGVAWWFVSARPTPG
jgi:zinc/manganese transport system permease protein